METRRGIIESSRPDQYVNAAANATGAASGSIGPCPEGFEWYVERLTCAQSGAAVAATALLEIYVQASSSTPNDASKQGRQDVAVGSAAANSAADQASPICVPAGYHLVAVWTGFTSADKLMLSTQMQVRRLVLEQTRERRHGHMLEHELDDKHGDLRAIPVVVGDEVAQV